jgi:hypothetical protein
VIFALQAKMGASESLRKMPSLKSCHKAGNAGALLVLPKRPTWTMTCYGTSATIGENPSVRLPIAHLVILRLANANNYAADTCI